MTTLHGVTVSTYRGGDQLPVVQIDLEESVTLRVNVNDGELATIREGGARIELPAHVRDLPCDALCIATGVWRACGDSRCRCR